MKSKSDFSNIICKKNTSVSSERMCFLIYAGCKLPFTAIFHPWIQYHGQFRQIFPPEFFVFQRYRYLYIIFLQQGKKFIYRQCGQFPQAPHADRVYRQLYQTNCPAPQSAVPQIIYAWQVHFPDNKAFPGNSHCHWGGVSPDTLYCNALQLPPPAADRIPDSPARKSPAKLGITISMNHDWTP